MELAEGFLMMMILSGSINEISGEFTHGDVVSIEVIGMRHIRNWIQFDS